MKITNQFPNYEIVGLSKKEHENFWIKENEFFKKYLKCFKLLLLATCIIFNVHLFLFNELNESVSIYTLILVYSMQILINSFCFRNIFHIYYTINILFLTLLNFLNKKFNYLTVKIEKLKNKKRIDNQKLSKLIHDFNFVYLEMVQTNEYFSPIIGVNFTHYVLLAIFTTFSISATDEIILQILVYFVLMFLYVLIIYLCSNWSNSVTEKIEMANFLLQTISFRPDVSIANKKKINLTSFILQDKKSGFTCFDLFKLSSYYGLIVSHLCYYIILI